MRYLLYASHTKIAMLSQQTAEPIWSRVLSKIKADVGFELSGIKAKISAENIEFYSQDAVEKVLRQLDRESSIGTIDHPKAWFRGDINMKWGAFQNAWADLAMFAGITASTLVCLLGSTYSLIGWPEGKDANHSIDYYTLRFFEGVADEHLRRYKTPEGDIRAEATLDGNGARNGKPEHNDVVTQTKFIYETLKKFPTPARKVEFVAKKITSEISGGRTLLIGSPLYVALSD